MGAGLSAGGWLILVNFRIDEAGCNPGAAGGVNMVDMLSTLWAELRDAGVMTGEEYAATTFARRERTVGEWTAPFADPQGGGPPGGTDARARRHPGGPPSVCRSIRGTR